MDALLVVQERNAPTAKCESPLESAPVRQFVTELGAKHVKGEETGSANVLVSLHETILGRRQFRY